MRELRDDGDVIVFRSTVSLYFLTSLWLSACDSSARSTAATQTAPSGQSRLLESCGDSSECIDGLRCVDNRCQVAHRSRLGDYYAATARSLAEAGDLGEAASFYNQALTQFEQEGIPMPTDLLCEQGRMLALGRAEPKLATAAARILHKCILEVPPSSHTARFAMDALVTLADSGLDPTLLSRSETADLYMTGEAVSTAPNVSELLLQVTADSKSKRRSVTALVTALQTAPAKAEFSTCWQGFYNTHKQEQLTVSFPVSYRFILDEDDESRDRVILKVGTHTATGKMAKAGNCIKNIASKIATEAAKGMREETRWQSVFTVEIGS